ncbi:glycerol-3-phosphate dehydrogenase [Hyphomicrobium sp.]|uniref:glycerol-3-phosphate dehydrogenase n=1 Tax=Hyphomicrobium sp. TaxID=82 RepID=UPI0013258975|nr:glycerol-3-phosphate dehydrogenase [Hyphomicrobium sp.]KAB2941554.1 MAG: glycerol-3-phosphate dehydrogenase [Hyphomicrobium sp.]
MIYDLVVAGGGINGAGIAADAAGRGLSVLLVEKADLGGATSSASSKLIHGGLRYLEHFEFRLVREALQEREVLLANAGHIIWPQRFILPQVPGGRSSLMLRAGLFLYDHLGQRRRIPASASLDLRRDPAGHALRRELTHGFAYWDCRVDDARLVVLNARAAADRGAAIKTRTRLRSARAHDGVWHVELHDAGGGLEVRARVLVNATGPWVRDVDGVVHTAAQQPAPLRLVKGSHIVVPRIEGANDAYLCQSADGRVVFAIPYEERFTLIGTTEVTYAGDPAAAAIGREEEDYLLALTQQFFVSPPARTDIVWAFAGVRPLYEDDSTASASAVTRDYRFELSDTEGAPLLTVLGGKLTTYRRLAEAALTKLAPYFPAMRPSWTASSPLPGGDLGAGGLAAFIKDLCRNHRGFDAAFLGRLARRYGTLVDDVLDGARSAADLGAPLGGGLTEREVLYLREHEWARHPDDVLWRRTKCGLHMNAEQRAGAEAAISRLL